jgi:signal peptidase I
MRLKLKTRFRVILREWGKPLLIVLLIGVTLRSAVADWNDVPTGSMKPTILEGDRIFVNKLAYGLRLPLTAWWLTRWSEPQRGDVVIFFSPEDGARLVKRVVGLPGDVVVMRRNLLIINGQPADYGPLDEEIVNQIAVDKQSHHQFAAEKLDDQAHPVMATPALPAMRSFGPTTVPEGHYYVLGDNRDVSGDSRFIGTIPAEQIVGRSSRVILSLDPESPFTPRWDRILRTLP